MIKPIPLNKLVPSPRNVRRSGDPAADLQLKADIEARGLLQNLVVTAARKPRGSFAVEAGGRRLKALKSLAEEGKLAACHEVSCLVIDDDGINAQEASLAENFQHLAMNPADECIAFQRLIDQGSDVEGIARRFGLTSRFVEGRLRLANLAPLVFAALGAGEISFETAKAYAATPDQERQAHVFEQVSRGYGGAHPDSIRRMMTQATASASDRRARFIGEEAYLAAGGRIDRDLFADDQATRWLDIAILERLASEKLAALAGEAAAEAGLAWVRPSLDSWIGPDQTEGLRRVPLAAPELSDEEKARNDDLDRELEELSLRLEDEDLDPAERQVGEARLEALQSEIRAISDKPPAMDEEARACIGTFLILDEAGRPKLHNSYYSCVAPDEPGDGEDGPTEPAPAIGAGQKRNGGLSQRLVDELSIQRRDILSVHVASDPGLALDLAIFLMVDREAGYSTEKSGSSLVAIPPQEPVFGFKTPEAAATVARAEAEEKLDRSWTGGETKADRFDAFRMLPEEARAAWLGHAVARTLEASLNLPGERLCRFHDHLGELIGIDVARWWRPAAANFFDRVPKSVMLSALDEVGGPALASRYALAKKAELAQSCERIFAGDFIAEVKVKDAAVRWLPGPMRFAGSAEADLGAQEGPASTGGPANSSAAEAAPDGDAPVEAAA
jgi:ParB family chromosome partitioning protein